MLQGDPRVSLSLHSQNSIVFCAPEHTRSLAGICRNCCGFHHVLHAHVTLSWIVGCSVCFPMTSRLAVITVDFTASMSCFNSIENITKDVVKPGVATLQSLRLYPLNALSITHLVELNLQPQPIALVGEGCIWFYGSRAWGKPIVPRKEPGPVCGSGWICRRSSEGACLSRTCRAAGHFRLEVAGFFPRHRAAAAGILAGNCSRSPEDLTTRSPAS